MREHEARTHVLELLRLAPGPGISVAAAACLLNLPADVTAPVLDGLCASHLLARPAPGRYEMGDLPPGAAAAGNGVPPAGARPARRRLVDFYLHTAYAADRLLSPNHAAIELAAPAEGCVPEPLASRDAALAWLDAEQDCVIAIRALALQERFYAAVWQLAWSLNGHFVRRGRTGEQLAQWRDALTAAQALGDPRARVFAHRYYGQACTRAGRHERAAAHLRRAAEIAERNDMPAEQGQVYYIFAWVREQAGQDAEALGLATRARHLFASTGQVMAEADALNAIGWYHTRLGDRGQAMASCREALGLSRQHGYPEGEAAALDSLGLLAQRAGLHAEAIGRYQAALALCRDLGNGYQEAGILQRLADSYAAMRDLGSAAAAWTQALTLYRGQRRAAEAAAAARRLASLAHAGEAGDVHIAAAT